MEPFIPRIKADFSELLHFKHVIRSLWFCETDVTFPATTVDKLIISLFQHQVLFDKTKTKYNDPKDNIWQSIVNHQSG